MELENLKKEWEKKNNEFMKVYNLKDSVEYIKLRDERDKIENQIETIKAKELETIVKRIA